MRSEALGFRDDYIDTAKHPDFKETVFTVLDAGMFRDPVSLASVAARLRSPELGPKLDSGAPEDEWRNHYEKQWQRLALRLEVARWILASADDLEGWRRQQTQMQRVVVVAEKSLGIAERLLAKYKMDS